MQCKVGLGVQHTGRVQSARPAARVNNSTCAGESHTRTAAVLQQAACVNADGQIYCKIFLGGPILTENEGKIQSTRLQIHPMIKIWQSILFCLSHRRFPSLCRSLSNRSFFYVLSAPGSPASFTYRPPQPAAGGVRGCSCATAVGRPRGSTKRLHIWLRCYQNLPHQRLIIP